MIFPRFAESSLRRSFVSLLVASSTTALAVGAHAQQAGGAKVTAEAMFEEGRRLMAAGNATDACPKFADSERLDPTAGTLLNLANCYEKTGRTATAWATYREAASLAASVQRQDLVTASVHHADALAPSLARVSVTAESPVEGLTVKLDGLPVGDASWGVPLPVDPGPHAVEASAPGRQTWTTTLTIAAEPRTTAVVVPPLQTSSTTSSVSPPPVAGAPTAQTTAPVSPTSTAPAAPAAATEPVPPASHAQRTIGWVIGGAGVVALAVGAGFAVSAKSKYNDSLKNCDPNSTNSCYPEGVSQRNDARSSGNVATVLGGLGLVAVAGGIVLWITEPSGDKHGASSGSVRVVAGPGSAMVTGQW